MIDIPDVPETLPSQRERGRLQAQDQRPEGAVHLLTLDDALTEGHLYRGYVALCGALVPASTLPSSSCPDDCDCDIRCCPACVRVAADWNAEVGQAGVDDPGPPGGTALPH